VTKVLGEQPRNRHVEIGERQCHRYCREQKKNQPNSTSIQEAAHLAPRSATITHRISKSARPIRSLSKAYQIWSPPPRGNAIAGDLTSKGLICDKGPTEGADGGTGALPRDPDGHPNYFVNMPGHTRKSPVKL
jgi:hypothetical protein